MNPFQRAAEVAARLRATYGARRRRTEDPLDVLIRTVLSQNTSDANSHKAFANLKDRFPTIRDLAAAEAGQIEEEIRIGGLYRRKARIIQNLARGILSEGLDLAKMDDSQARKCLCSLDGVGPKTASCVLLFGLGRDVMPVDTHVCRLSRRIGLLPDKVPIERADVELERVVRPDLRYGLHLDLIQHGRTVCRPARPRCDSCPIIDLCRFGRSRKPARAPR